MEEELKRQDEETKQFDADEAMFWIREDRKQKRKMLISLTILPVSIEILLLYLMEKFL